MAFSFVALRRSLTAAVLMLVAIAVAWGLLWSVAAREYRRVIDRWIETGRAAGYDISYDNHELFGFPRHVVLRFVNLRWKNTNGITFHAGNMDLASTPWAWKHFNAKLKHQVEIVVPLDEAGYSLVLGGEEGYAAVDLNDDGIWIFSHVELRDAKLGRAPDYIFQMEFLEASARRPEIAPQNPKQPGLILRSEAENVTLPSTMPSPFGPKMAQMEASLRVLGAVPDVRLKDKVAAWNTTSGIVEFDRLHMEWGPLRMTAKGTIGFDDDLQPEGAFSGAIGNHEAVLKALMDHEFIAKRQAAMLDSALSLFAKPSSLDLSHSSGIEVPMTVQLGGLFLGPVRVFTFPEIDWPKAGEDTEEKAPPTPVSAAPVEAQPSAPASPPPAETLQP